jgi:hypothetical protein
MHAKLFILSLLCGILCLVAGLFITRLTWRSDVAPYGMHSPTLEIALHPERFARADRLGVIRLLNLLGAGLVLCAVAVLLYDLALAIRFPRG